MKPETAQRMNELARMTPEQRSASLAREIFDNSAASFAAAIADNLEQQRVILADMEATLKRMAERRTEPDVAEAAAFRPDMEDAA